MKEKIFNIISLVFIICFVSYFSFRVYNAYKISTKIIDDTYITDRLINSISKYDTNNPLNKYNDEYIFIGKVNNNYLKYQGYLWRIIKINSNNELVLILDETLTYLPNNTSLHWLNNNNEFTINYELLNNTTQCIDKFDNIDNSSCNDNNNDYIVGQLSIDDYIKIGGNKSYLNNGTNFWTSNIYDDNNSWYISEDGLISYSNNNIKHGIRPIITLKSNIELIDGNGTIDNPYIIEERNIKTLKDTLQGEYISYNNEIWKVMYNRNNRIKIINTDYIKINNKNIEYFFDDKTNQIDTSKLITYLNTSYLKNLSNKEYLIKGYFYTGIYYKDNTNYTDSYKTKIINYVGIPSINEPYIYDLDNIFLSNPSNIDNLTIYSINNNNLYEDSISSIRYIRPTLYLKDTINISSGNGTIDNPYILGGLDATN